MNLERKEIIKFFIAVLIIILIIAIVVSIVIKYQVNGEANMPFELKKVTIISTAEGEQNSENPENVKWDININQNNDIYFNIVKNENYKKDAIINSVRIENINVTKEPEKGEIKSYMPNSGEGRKFVYNDEMLIDGSLTFNGAKETNEKNLEINNQGGTISIRIANLNVGKFVSDEDLEVTHNGTLLKLAEIPQEEVNFEVKFDIIIEINHIKYKATINLVLPYGNIGEEGIAKQEIEEKNQLVFKRIK